MKIAVVTTLLLALQRVSAWIPVVHRPSSTIWTAASAGPTRLSVISSPADSESNASPGRISSNDTVVGRISSPRDTTTEQSDHRTTGRILEGGKVIDFSSVKASSKAEKALAEARKTVLAGTATTGSGDKNSILGINQEVIDEVGHELGAFADDASIQACAAYLRSKAPASLFTPKSDDGFVRSDVAKFQKLLDRAYCESGEVTGAFAKTFYMGTMLLGQEARKAIWAIYVWCRRTDEIVDAPRDNDEEMLLDLSRWELRLENLWKYGEVVDVYDLCLLDVRINYPNLDIQPFLDMIRGMLMDVPGLGQERYETFDALHLYCYRVAGTVGVMSLPIFGCAPGFNDDIAR